MLRKPLNPQESLDTLHTFAINTQARRNYFMGLAAVRSDMDPGLLEQFAQEMQTATESIGMGLSTYPAKAEFLDNLDLHTSDIKAIGIDSEEGIVVMVQKPDQQLSAVPLGSVSRFIARG